jgi:hypothetical protein
MKRMMFVISVVLGSAMLFTSCAKFPQAEYDAAKASVSEVKAAGADVYVPTDFKVLTDSLQKTEVTLNYENSKWFKTFKESKLGLAGVTNLAVEVKGKNTNRKDQLKKENETLIKETTELVALDKELLTNAPKGKDGRAALAAIAGDIAVVETTVTEATTLNASNDFLGANGKLKSAKDKAVTIQTELQNAIDKSKGHTK